jgi:hypothetical protein
MYGQERDHVIKELKWPGQASLSLSLCIPSALSFQTEEVHFRKVFFEKTFQKYTPPVCLPAVSSSLHTAKGM